jgi:hypothetical protein
MLIPSNPAKFQCPNLMMGRHGEGVFDLLGLMWFKSPEEKAMPMK